MDDDGGFLGLNLDGNQPKMEIPSSGLGHNSEAAIIDRVNSTIESLVKLEGEHEEAIQTLVENQEDEREAILLVLGRQLLEGKKGKSKGNFGKWVSDNFSNLSDTVNTHEQAAILWAAEFPEQHQEMLEKHSRVRTTRGLYDKWKAQKKANDKANGNSGGSSGNKGKGNSTSGKGNAGIGSGKPENNTDKPDENPKGKGDINTENPDTTKVKADATMIASSLVGVVTNMLMFEQTQGREVGEEELASAVLHEIRNQSVEQLTDDQVQEFIEQKLKRVLRIVTNSIPTLDGAETNVVSIHKTMEKFQ